MINKLKVKIWGMKIGDIFLLEDGQPVSNTTLFFMN